VLFLYTPELDALMHGVGLFDHAVESKLRGYERFLRSVIERGSKCHRDVTLCVLSDHGMTDVHKTVDLWGEVTKAGYRLGRDYLAFYDSTMARFWCDDGTRDRVAALLQDAGVGLLLSDAELAAYGCLFEDRSYGNAIFLLHPGIMIVPSFMGREGLAAMHGYDPADRYSVGCFLTTDTAEDLPGSILDVKRYLLTRLPGGR
jgi:predicted AlkP superfamily pyrophosphatase or phosphodiesterase